MSRSNGSFSGSSDTDPESVRFSSRKALEASNSVKLQESGRSKQGSSRAHIEMGDTPKKKKVQLPPSSCPSSIPSGSSASWSISSASSSSSSDTLSANTGKDASASPRASINTPSQQPTPKGASRKADKHSEPNQSDTASFKNPKAGRRRKVPRALSRTISSSRLAITSRTKKESTKNADLPLMRRETFVQKLVRKQATLWDKHGSEFVDKEQDRPLDKHQKLHDIKEIRKILIPYYLEPQSSEDED